MEDNKAPSNVIQFPVKRKEPDVQGEVPPSAASHKKTSRKKRSKKNLAGTVLAIVLASGAANRMTFGSAGQASSELASKSAADSGRAIASVEAFAIKRDADWEKELAESLALPQPREPSSLQVGRSATAEEKLRWGTLEEKYTITYSAEDHLIDTILLQDATQSAPSYVLSRDKFLKEYGRLFRREFASARLTSVEKQNDRTVESYMLLDKNHEPKGEARFELDRHKRLLSLKVQPPKI